MKKTFIIILMALLAAVSCKHDLDYMLPDDVLGFRSSLVEVPVFDGSYAVPVVKSGSGRASANFKIDIADATALESYNKENKTSFVALESSSFTLEKNTGSIAVEDVFWTSKLSWDTQKVGNAVREGNCVIALSLTSDDIEVAADRSIVLVHIKPVTATLDKTTTFTYYTLQTKPAESANTYENRINLDATLASMDLSFSFDVDNSQVEWYNQQYYQGSGTTATSAPDGAVTLPRSIIVRAGETGLDFSVQVNVDKLYDESGKPAADSDWIVPLRLTCTTSDCVAISEDLLFIRIVAFNEEEADPVGEPKEIWGPWDVLEGSEINIVTEGKADWYGVKNGGTVDCLVDGNLETEWWSLWDIDNVFPITFVFDMKEQHIFDMLYIADAIRFQGQYRNYRFSISKSYKGESTSWTVIAEGRRGYDWKDKVNVYECPITQKAAGRYLKFEILNAEFPEDPDYVHDHGRLAEIYGHGI